MDKKTDRTCYATLKNDVVTRMIREETRIGELCFPRRGKHRGGSLTGDSADGVAWSGSECMLFAKTVVRQTRMWTCNLSREEQGK